MTEQEVYKVLGWPIDGCSGTFLLPICNSEEDCVPYKCTNCTWRGIFYGSYRETNCINCNSIIEIMEGK